MNAALLDRFFSPRFAAYWVLLLAMLLGLGFQGSRGLWEPDEGRYTNVALQMLRSDDWLSLRRNDETLHMTKPPLTYWAVAASVATFGHNEWAVRLPNALAYLASVLLVLWMGKTLVHQRPWLPGLILATAPLPFFAGNIVSTDTVLAAAESLAVAGYVAARFGAAGARGVWLMWLGFALAFMTKGPPGLLPLLAILAFNQLQSGGLRLWHSFGPLLFLLLSLPWYVYVVVQHPGLLDYFLGEEVVARVASAKFDRFPQWWGGFAVYLPSLALGALPWWWMARRERPQGGWSWREWRPETQFLVLWLAVPLLVFFLARSRLPLYVLPLFAPIALLLARALEPCAFTPRRCLGIALSVAILFALKAALAVLPTSKDARAYSRELRELHPQPIGEIVYVEDMARYGTALYCDCEIEKVALHEITTEQPISSPEYDEDLPRELSEVEPDRIFIMKPDRSVRFEALVRSRGAVPVALGTLRDRSVYRVPQFAAVPGSGVE